MDHLQSSVEKQIAKIVWKIDCPISDENIIRRRGMRMWQWILCSGGWYFYV